MGGFWGVLGGGNYGFSGKNVSRERGEGGGKVKAKQNNIRERVLGGNRWGGQPFFIQVRNFFQGSADPKSPSSKNPKKTQIFKLKIPQFSAKKQPQNRVRGGPGGVPGGVPGGAKNPENLPKFARAFFDLSGPKTSPLSYRAKKTQKNAQKICVKITPKNTFLSRAPRPPHPPLPPPPPAPAPRN